MMRQTGGSGQERQLLRLFRELSAPERQTLLAFAEFLHQRQAPAPAPAPERVPQSPLELARPAQETVVGAIKRLSQSYAMLDRAPLLNDASALMSAHVLEGRDAREVIDELEALFARRYQEYVAAFPSES